MTDKQKGIFFIIMTSLFFALMGAFMKLATDIPSMEKAFFRNFISLFIALTLFYKSKKLQIKEYKEQSLSNFKIFKILTKSKAPKVLFARCAIGIFGVLGNFYALDRLSLADATILQKLSPFFTLIFSAIILKDHINFKQILCIILAFIGCYVTIRPEFSAETIPYLIAVIGAMAAAFAYTCIRYLGTKKEDGYLIVLAFSAYSVLFIFPIMIGNFVPLMGMNLLYITLGSICATGAQLSITKAYALAPSKEISIYEYFQVVFAGVLGLFIFNSIPDKYSILGYSIIILASFLLYRVNNPKIKKLCNSEK